MRNFFWYLHMQVKQRQTFPGKFSYCLLSLLRWLYVRNWIKMWCQLMWSINKKKLSIVGDHFIHLKSAIEKVDSDIGGCNEHCAIFGKYYMLMNVKFFYQQFRTIHGKFHFLNGMKLQRQCVGHIQRNLYRVYQ